MANYRVTLTRTIEFNDDDLSMLLPWDEIDEDVEVTIDRLTDEQKRDMLLEYVANMGEDELDGFNVTFEKVDCVETA